MIGLLRDIVANKLGEFGDAEALTFATEKFELLKSGSPVSPSIRKMVLKTVARNADSIDDLVTLHKNSKSIEVQEDACRAIGCVKGSLIQKAIDFALDPERRPNGSYNPRESYE